jgi:RNA polymerase sigma factor (sigma-70 family)|tara:strand:- start:2221 stop:2835 length:615 start_codon:yes stop_codon:yes gene_type:complete
MPDPTVFVVDDDDAIRRVLRWLITSVDLQVVEYKSADDFFAAFKRDAVGCLLLDVRMPGMSGLELQRRISKECVGLPIIIITGHADVPMAIEAMKNGAFDFIEKPFNNQALLDIVQKAIKESIRNDEKRAEDDKREQTLSTLTPRERQVLDQIIDGETNKVIARNLGISKKTVEAHRAKVMKKLSVRSLADLVRIVRQNPKNRD